MSVEQGKSQEFSNKDRKAMRKSAAAAVAGGLVSGIGVFDATVNTIPQMYEFQPDYGYEIVDHSQDNKLLVDVVFGLGRAMGAASSLGSIRGIYDRRAWRRRIKKWNKEHPKMRIELSEDPPKK